MLTSTILKRQTSPETTVGEQYFQCITLMGNIAKELEQKEP